MQGTSETISQHAADHIFWFSPNSPQSILLLSFLANLCPEANKVVQDLEKDFQERQAQATDQPKSLWQEVTDIGEEFVEFLEQEIGAREKKPSKGASAQSRCVLLIDRINANECIRQK